MAENDKNTNTTQDDKHLVSDSAGADKHPNVAPIVIPDDAKN